MQRVKALSLKLSGNCVKTLRSPSLASVYLAPPLFYNIVVQALLNIERRVISNTGV